MPMFVPVDDELVLTKIPPGKTEGGILMPDVDEDAKDRNGEYVHKVGRGVVVALGPGRYNPHSSLLIPACPREAETERGMPLGVYVAGVKVGDVVLYQKRSAVEVRHEGVTYIVCDGQHVLGIVPATA